MRLVQRETKLLTYATPNTPTSGFNAVVANFDGVTHTEVQANVQPMSGGIFAEMYGQRLTYMQTAYMPHCDIAEGDGVWINNPTTGNPDYSCVAVRKWNDHIVVDLSKLV